MKNILLALICGLLIGCSGSNYGANGTLKGKIYKAIDTPPGDTNVAEVVLEGKTGYSGQLFVPVNPADGTFEIDINLGTESLGPPVVYVNAATFDLKLKVNGLGWSDDTTSSEAKAFVTGVRVEAKKTTDIGIAVLSGPFWK
ncbi:MAG: hypothetical protein PHX78_06890 [bacterium]|nr:hypothetical protein [bacterium]